MQYVGNHSDQAYRVVSNRKAEITDHNRLTPDYEDPRIEATEEAPIVLVDVGLDTTVAEDALELLQVFGLDDLDESEMQRAISIAYSDQYNLSGYKEWNEDSDFSQRSYLELMGVQPFWQGGVTDRCENSKCSSVTYDRTAFVPFPVRGWLRGVFFREDWRFAGDVQRKRSVRVIAKCEVAHLLVIFRYCDECHTVFTCNQAC